jgi:hypothetical protein
MRLAQRCLPDCVAALFRAYARRRDCGVHVAILKVGFSLSSAGVYLLSSVHWPRTTSRHADRREDACVYSAAGLRQRTLSCASGRVAQNVVRVCQYK